jgi:uncharacterized membrane protein YphA (DoxX/SURF4 family)
MKVLPVLLKNAYMHLGLRLFLGVTFIVSAVTKLPMRTDFIDMVKGYNMLPDSLASAYGVALPWLELSIGVFLVLGILVRFGALGTLLISATFMVANIGAIVQGQEQCGTCFGEAFPLAAPAALALDCVMIAAALVLLIYGYREQKLSVDEFFLRRAERLKSQLESDSEASADEIDNPDVLQHEAKPEPPIDKGGEQETRSS